MQLPFSMALPFSKLEHLLAYYPVSDTAGVAVLARRVDRLACPRGFIKGEWIPEAADGSRGSLLGMWYDLFGIPVGTMAGSFGTDSDGARSLEGWLSGVWLAVVLAEFKGTWSGDGHGYFEGTYRYLNSKETGILWGAFDGDALSLAQPKFPLVGIWRADCPVITTDPAAAGPVCTRATRSFPRLDPQILQRDRVVHRRAFRQVADGALPAYGGQEQHQVAGQRRVAGIPFCRIPGHTVPFVPVYLSVPAVHAQVQARARLSRRRSGSPDGAPGSCPGCQRPGPNLSAGRHSCLPPSAC